MPDVHKQIAAGQLVCPLTKQVLHSQGDRLYTVDGRLSYPMAGVVPIMLSTEQQQQYLAAQDGAMVRTYHERERIGVWHRFKTWLNHIPTDYRSQGAIQAFNAVVLSQPDALCLSIGGGPMRVAPHVTNLNIDLFANVDVVGDAYTLPYADGSVDSVHCEAVLEHLEFPDRAVGEIARVLRSRGQVFAATPLLQGFHAYPNHFQNYTVEGQRRLLERAGLQTLAAGVCTGPTFALLELVEAYAREFVPTALLRKASVLAIHLAARAIRPLDVLVNRNPRAHILASTTFVHAIKP